MKRYCVLLLIILVSPMAWPQVFNTLTNNPSLISANYNFLLDPTQSLSSQYQLSNDLGAVTLFSRQNCFNGNSGASSFCQMHSKEIEIGARYSQFHSNGSIETYVGAGITGFNYAGALSRRYSPKLSVGVATIPLKILASSLN